MTRILILDDEPGLATFFGKILELAGYECSCAVTGNEALDILAHEPVDLFIQDCLRPEPNGLQLYEILKGTANLRHLPILFFSAGCGPQDTAHLRAPYGDEHIQKPATAEGLLAVIMTILRRFGRHVPTRDERWAQYEQIRGNWQQHEWNLDFEKKFREIDSWLTEYGA
jgi:DNA-binding response OmpR family regulator